MKLQFLKFSFLALMLICSVGVFAQDGEGEGEPAPTNELECEAGPVEHKQELRHDICIPKSRYPVYSDALKRFQTLLLRFVKCGECDEEIADVVKCHPIFVRFTEAGPTNHDDEYWCFGGPVSFEWKCSKCIDTGGFHDGEDEKDGSPSYQFGALDNLDAFKEVGYIKNVYPNPTVGDIFTEIIVEENNSDVQLSLTNISGKVIFEKTYENVPRSHFSTKDHVNNLPKGMYILSVHINDQLIGTSKLLVAQ